MSCENCEESAYVIDKLAKLLAEIAVIVNGVEPHDTSWSYHDLPEKVRALKQAPPAAAVPEDVLTLLRDLEPALDAYERSGRTSEIKDGAVHWTLNARHYDAQRLRGRVDAMLAAERAQGVGNE